MHESRVARYGTTDFRTTRKPHQKCKVSGCERYRANDGLCNIHDYALRRHGDVNWQPNPPTAEERYHASYNKKGFHDCWPWHKGTGRRGYGKFNVNRKTVVASRYGWELINGPIPDGYFICHHCDNPGCQNPNHWFIGKAKDNCHDMIRKGRFKSNPYRNKRNGQFSAKK